MTCKVPLLLMLGAAAFLDGSTGSCNPSEAATTAARWTGKGTLAACATVKYPPLYKPRSFRPQLKIEVGNPDGDVMRVRIVYEQFGLTYSCDLRGRVWDQEIVLDAGQTCRLPINTSDVCTLKENICPGSGPLSDCASATASGMGELIATVKKGSVSRLGAEYVLTLDLAATGCVLAVDHNGNIPVRVRGGEITVRRCS